MDKRTDPGSRLLARAEVAELFGVSPSTITRWADAGKLPTTKTLGGHRRYDAKVVMELTKQFIKENADMQDVIMGIPALWADHHVLTVRNALMGQDGVAAVNASSAFKTVRVTFDADILTKDAISDVLREAGFPPAAPRGTNGHSHVPVSTGKKDPAWAKLDMRTNETNSTDIEMSGEFRKY